MKLVLRICLVIVFAGLIIMPSQASGQFFFMEENPLVGKSAPEFNLYTARGQRLTLTEYRSGQRAIVFFWATWCPHCRTQLKVLNETKSDIEKEGIKIALVDTGEEKGIVRNYLKRFKIKFDVFLDDKGTIAEEYGIVGVPTFYFVDEDGIVRAVEHSLPENYTEIF